MRGEQQGAHVGDPPRGLLARAHGVAGGVERPGSSLLAAGEHSGPTLGDRGASRRSQPQHPVVAPPARGGRGKEMTAGALGPRADREAPGSRPAQLRLDGRCPSTPAAALNSLLLQSSGGGGGSGGGGSGRRLREEDARGGGGSCGGRLLGVREQRLGDQAAARARVQPGSRLERRVLGVRHAAQAVGHGEGELVLFEQRLGLAPRPVLVVGMLLHVHGSQALRLVDERPLLRLGEQLPLGAQALADLRVVHLRVLLGHLPPLSPRPHHEGVHGPLDVVHRLGHAVAVPRLQPAAAATGALGLRPEEINVGCQREPAQRAAVRPRVVPAREERTRRPALGRGAASRTALVCLVEL